MHGDIVCPKYGEPVLPNDKGNCSLCDTPYTAKSIFCHICKDNHTRRYSFPIDEKFKSNIKAHMASHTA